MDSFNFTCTAETASALREWFDKKNREFIEDLLDGKGQFTLEHGDRKVMVAPVRRGRWIELAMTGEYKCSVCGRGSRSENTFQLIPKVYWNYCPNCGAKMEED